VSWSAQSNVDRYTVNYDLQQGDAQLGLCKQGSQSGSVTADSTATSVTVEGTGGDGEFRLRAFTTYLSHFPSPFGTGTIGAAHWLWVTFSMTPGGLTPILWPP